MKQPEALRLAEIIGGDCAAELRRLHNEVTDLKQALDIADAVFKERDRLHEANQELMHWLKYIQAQTHIGHIHDTASAAITKATGENT